jgi:hypothetical protein
LVRRIDVHHPCLDQQADAVLVSLPLVGNISGLYDPPVLEHRIDIRLEVLTSTDPACQAECAPSSVRNLLAYCTGWLLVLGWHTTVAGCGVIVGNLTKYCILLYHPSSTAIGSQWFPTLLAIIVLLCGGFFNLYCMQSKLRRLSCYANAQMS